MTFASISPSPRVPASWLALRVACSLTVWHGDDGAARTTRRANALARHLECRAPPRVLSIRQELLVPPETRAN